MTVLQQALTLITIAETKDYEHANNIPNEEDERL